jgi:outer membrane lipoprotein-sorting protein
MRKLFLFSLLLLLAVPALAADIKSGQDLIAAMHKKYAGKWYKTLTFVQKTTNYKPDGTSTAETWYEAMSLPGNLRIDIVPVEKGNGILFANGMVHSFRDGKLAGGRPFVHPLMVLGFDVYGQPVETTVEQVKGIGIDLSVIHEEKWQGRDVYVVGAKQGDLSVPQVWVDKKNLYFVRLIQLTGKDKKNIQETQFNKYVKAKGGWVAPEVIFTVDGKRTTLEEYTDIQADVELSADLWNPEKWMSVDKTYFKIKK